MHSSDLFDVTIVPSPGAPSYTVRDCTTDMVDGIRAAGAYTSAEISWTPQTSISFRDAVDMLTETRPHVPPRLGDRVGYCDHSEHGTVLAVIDANMIGNIYLAVLFDGQTAPRICLLDETWPATLEYGPDGVPVHR